MSTPVVSSKKRQADATPTSTNQSSSSGGTTIKSDNSCSPHLPSSGKKAKIQREECMKEEEVKRGGQGGPKERKHPTPFSAEEDHLLIEWMKELVNAHTPEAYKLMEGHDRAKSSIKARIVILLRRLDG